MSLLITKMINHGLVVNVKVREICITNVKKRNDVYIRLKTRIFFNRI